MDLNVEDGNTGKVEVIEVSVDATVADLKKAARTAFGLASEVELRIQDKVVEKETQPLSALDVQAGSTVTVCAAGAHYPDSPGYGYTISTWENDGDNHHTDHFNDLSLETARHYAIHLRCFTASHGSNRDKHDITSQLERDLGESYDEGVLPTVVGMWLDGDKWRVLEDVRLTFTPAASKSTTLDWNSFVVDVPGLLKDGTKRRRRERREESAPETSGEDFCLTVNSYEGDADNSRTDTHDNLTLTQARLYSSTLAYCDKFGNRDRSLHDEEETAVIDEVCTALGIDDDVGDLMKTLFGTWLEGERWRYVDGVTLTSIPNRDLIWDIDYDAFEKEAFELHQKAQRADASDAEEE